MWSETRPNVGGHILREDGRICLLNTYTVPRPYRKRGSNDLVYPAPGLLKRSMITQCGDVIQTKIVSLCAFYPEQTKEPVTCPKCLALKGVPAPRANPK